MNNTPWTTDGKPQTMNHGSFHRHTDCDHAIRNGRTTTTSVCTMMCAGDATQIRGGGNRLNVYKTNARTLPSAIATYNGRGY
jgi:hypothetical protein